MNQEIQLFQTESEKTMSLAEIAKVLGYEKDTLRKLVKELFPESIKHGKETRLNEAQITELKKNLVPRTVALKHHSENSTTGLERKETIMLAFQYLKEDYEAEKLKRIALENKIKEDEPKLSFYERVKESDNTIDFLRFGRLVKLGRNTLMNILREKGVIDSHNLAYQNLVDVGVFEIKESTYKVDGKEMTSLKTVITGKGQAWLVRKLTEWGFLDSGVSLTNKN